MTGAQSRKHRQCLIPIVAQSPVGLKANFLSPDDTCRTYRPMRKNQAEKGFTVIGRAVKVITCAGKK